MGWKYDFVIFPKEQVVYEVDIQLQGRRRLDHKAANEKVGLKGKRGAPTQTAHKSLKGHEPLTWHHATYEPKTNTAKMQLVTRTDHQASTPHRGSVAEFEKIHGVEYETDEAVEKAAKLNKQNYVCD